MKRSPMVDVVTPNMNRADDILLRTAAQPQATPADDATSTCLISTSIDAVRPVSSSASTALTAPTTVPAPATAVYPPSLGGCDSAQSTGNDDANAALPLDTSCDDVDSKDAVSVDSSCDVTEFGLSNKGPLSPAQTADLVPRDVVSSAQTVDAPSTAVAADSAEICDVKSGSSDGISSGITSDISDEDDTNRLLANGGKRDEADSNRSGGASLMRQSSYRSVDSVASPPDDKSTALAVVASNSVPSVTTATCDAVRSVAIIKSEPVEPEEAEITDAIKTDVKQSTDAIDAAEYVSSDEDAMETEETARSESSRPSDHKTEFVNSISNGGDGDDETDLKFSANDLRCIAIVDSIHAGHIDWIEGGDGDDQMMTTDAHEATPNHRLDIVGLLVNMSRTERQLYVDELLMARHHSTSPLLTAARPHICLDRRVINRAVAGLERQLTRIKSHSDHVALPRDVASMVYLKLGHLNLALDKFDAAYAAYTRHHLLNAPIGGKCVTAASAPVGSASSNYGLGLAAFHSGRYGQAIKALQLTLAMEPVHTHANAIFIRLGIAFKLTGNFRSSLACFQIAKRIRQTPPATGVDAALGDNDVGATSSEMEALRPTVTGVVPVPLAFNGDNAYGIKLGRRKRSVAAAHHTLAHRAAMTKLREMGARAADDENDDKSATVEPAISEQLLSNDSIAVELDLHAAHAAQSACDWAAAIKRYEALLISTESRQTRAEINRQLGLIYYTMATVEPERRKSAPGSPDKMSCIESAVRHLRRAHDLEPEAAGRTLYLMGRCYATVNRVHDAFIAYRNAVDKQATANAATPANGMVSGVGGAADASTWCSIGVLYQQQNQPLDALQAYICAVQIDKGHTSSWLNLASLYESVAQWRDALMCYANASATASHVKMTSAKGKSSSVSSQISPSVTRISINASGDYSSTGGQSGGHGALPTSGRGSRGGGSGRGRGRGRGGSSSTSAAVNASSATSTGTNHTVTNDRARLDECASVDSAKLSKAEGPVVMPISMLSLTTSASASQDSHHRQDITSCMAAVGKRVTTIRRALDLPSTQSNPLLTPTPASSTPASTASDCREAKSTPPLSESVAVKQSPKRATNSTPAQAKLPSVRDAWNMPVTNEVTVMMRALTKYVQMQMLTALRQTPIPLPTRPGGLPQAVPPLNGHQMQILHYLQSQPVCALTAQQGRMLDQLSVQHQMHGAYIAAWQEHQRAVADKQQQQDQVVKQENSDAAATNRPADDTVSGDVNDNAKPQQTMSLSMTDRDLEALIAQSDLGSMAESLLKQMQDSMPENGDASCGQDVQVGQQSDRNDMKMTPLDALDAMTSGGDADESMDVGVSDEDQLDFGDLVTDDADVAKVMSTLMDEDNDVLSVAAAGAEYGDMQSLVKDDEPVVDGMERSLAVVEAHDADAKKAEKEQHRAEMRLKQQRLWDDIVLAVPLPPSMATANSSDTSVLLSDTVDIQTDAVQSIMAEEHAEAARLRRVRAKEDRNQGRRGGLAAEADSNRTGDENGEEDEEAALRLALTDTSFSDLYALCPSRIASPTRATFDASTNVEHSSGVKNGRQPVARVLHAGEICQAIYQNLQLNAASSDHTATSASGGSSTPPGPLSTVGGHQQQRCGKVRTPKMITGASGGDADDLSAIRKRMRLPPPYRQSANMVIGADGLAECCRNFWTHVTRPTGTPRPIGGTHNTDDDNVTDKWNVSHPSPSINSVLVDRAEKDGVNVSAIIGVSDDAASDLGRVTADVVSEHAAAVQTLAASEKTSAVASNENKKPKPPSSSPALSLPPCTLHPLTKKDVNDMSVVDALMQVRLDRKRRHHDASSNTRKMSCSVALVKNVATALKLDLGVFSTHNIAAAVGSCDGDAVPHMDVVVQPKHIRPSDDSVSIGIACQQQSATQSRHEFEVHEVRRLSVPLSVFTQYHSRHFYDTLCDEQTPVSAAARARQAAVKQQQQAVNAAASVGPTGQAHAAAINLPATPSDGSSSLADTDGLYGCDGNSNQSPATTPSQQAPSVQASPRSDEAAPVVGAVVEGSGCDGPPALPPSTVGGGGGAVRGRGGSNAGVRRKRNPKTEFPNSQSRTISQSLDLRLGYSCRLTASPSTFRSQLSELHSRLPGWCRPVSATTLMSHVAFAQRHISSVVFAGDMIASTASVGVSAKKPYHEHVHLEMRVPHTRSYATVTSTTPHGKGPNAAPSMPLAMVDINVGPSDVEWFAVETADLARFMDVNGCGSASALASMDDGDSNSTYVWPSVTALQRAGVSIVRATQRAGDLVWMEPHCVYWSSSTGWSSGVRFYVAPVDAVHFSACWSSYAWTRRQARLHVAEQWLARFDESSSDQQQQSMPSGTMAFIHLAWSLALHIRVRCPRLNLLLMAVVRASLEQTLTTHYLLSVADCRPRLLTAGGQIAALVEPILDALNGGGSGSGGTSGGGVSGGVGGNGHRVATAQCQGGPLTLGGPSGMQPYSVYYCIACRRELFGFVFFRLVFGSPATDNGDIKQYNAHCLACAMLTTPSNYDVASSLGAATAASLDHVVAFLVRHVRNDVSSLPLTTEERLRPVFVVGQTHQLTHLMATYDAFVNNCQCQCPSVFGFVPSFPTHNTTLAASSLGTSINASAVTNAATSSSVASSPRSSSAVAAAAAATAAATDLLSSAIMSGDKASAMRLLSNMVRSSSSSPHAPSSGKANSALVQALNAMSAGHAKGNNAAPAQNLAQQHQQTSLTALKMLLNHENGGTTAVASHLKQHRQHEMLAHAFRQQQESANRKGGIGHPKSATAAATPLSTNASGGLNEALKVFMSEAQARNLSLPAAVAAATHSLSPTKPPLKASEPTSPLHHQQPQSQAGLQAALQTTLKSLGINVGMANGVAGSSGGYTATTSPATSKALTASTLSRQLMAKIQQASAVATSPAAVSQQQQQQPPAPFMAMPSTTKKTSLVLKRVPSMQQQQRPLQHQQQHGPAFNERQQFNASHTTKRKRLNDATGLLIGGAGNVKRSKLHMTTGNSNGQIGAKVRAKAAAGSSSVQAASSGLTSTQQQAVINSLSQQQQQSKAPADAVSALLNSVLRKQQQQQQKTANGSTTMTPVAGSGPPPTSGDKSVTTPTMLLSQLIAASNAQQQQQQQKIKLKSVSSMAGSAASQHKSLSTAATAKSAVVNGNCLTNGDLVVRRHHGTATGDASVTPTTPVNSTGVANSASVTAGAANPATLQKSLAIFAAAAAAAAAATNRSSTESKGDD